MGRIIFGTETFFKYINQFSGFFSVNQQRHVGQYLAGLIYYVGRKTIFQICFCVMMRSVDEGALRKFLTRSSWNEKALHVSRIMGLNEAVEVMQLNEAVEKTRGEKEKGVGFVITDDTTNPKRGKKMRGLGWNYSTLHDGQVWSHCLVTTHFCYGDFDYPLLIDPYRKKEECGERGFRTKIELAEKQIETVPLPEGINIYGLVDSWYMCRKIVAAYRHRGIKVIGRLKSNRVVFQEGRCDWNLITYAKFYSSKRQEEEHGFRYITFFNEDSQKKQNVWVREDVVTISNLGRVKLLTIKRKLRGWKIEPIFIACTDVTLSAEQIIEYYQKRWTIEVFYKVAKQNLGLAQYQMRHWRGTIRHWSLVFLAYSYLSLQRLQNSHLKTVGQVQRMERQKNLLNLVKWQEQKKKAGYSVENIARQLAA